MCDNLALITADIAPEEGLLGTDFLCKFGAVIDLNGKLLCFNKKETAPTAHPSFKRESVCDC